MAATAAFVVLSLAATIADGRGWIELGEWLFGDQEISVFWYYWYSTPVELPMQWLSLVAAIIVFVAAARIAGRLGDDEVCRFGRWMGLGVGLMLLEDAFDIRHRLRYFLNRFDGEVPFNGYGVLTSFVELAYFGLLAAVLVVVYVRYRSVIWSRTRLALYLTSAYLLYGVAVGSSWAGAAFRSVIEGDQLYARVGDRVVTLLDIGPEDGGLEAGTDFSVGFWFMDRVYEESIELLGAAALLTAGLMLYGEYFEKGGD